MVTSRKNRLGEILVEKGFITEQQLYTAIEEQSQYRQRSGSAQIINLKHPPQLVTVASATEIQHAVRDSLQHVYLHNFFSSLGDVITQAANDPD